MTSFTPIQLIENSRILASFTVGVHGFRFVDQAPAHDHMGALLADGVLQAGLNYKSVVFPRVSRIAQIYPSAAVLSGLLKLLEVIDIGQLLDWRHPEKISRFKSIVEVLPKDIESVGDFRWWMDERDGRNKIAALSGFGPKTVDYLHRLSGGAHVAVDRHVFGFLARAGLHTRDYESAKEVVSRAADLLGIDRGCFDASIWRHMSA